MDSTRLYELFRSDVQDTAQPYLWTDDEVWAYLNDAYTMFVRLTGGVPDFTSPITEVPVVSGEPTSQVSTKILRFLSARLVSTGEDLEILNWSDASRMTRSDYGISVPITLDDLQGPVRSMVIGMQRNLVRWVNVPASDDTVRLHVYRLPLEEITGESQELVDVDEQHHLHLLSGMKAVAYRKQDAETFDRARADENEMRFRSYCAQVVGEFDRYKHKTRVVSYGGI